MSSINRTILNCACLKEEMEFASIWQEMQKQSAEMVVEQIVCEICFQIELNDLIMSTAELQNQLIRKVVNINKDYLLEELLNIIELETSDDIVQLTNFEKEQIDIGLRQIKNGETITNEAVEKEMKDLLAND